MFHCLFLALLLTLQETPAPVNPESPSIGTEKPDEWGAGTEAGTATLGIGGGAQPAIRFDLAPPTVFPDVTNTPAPEMEIHPPFTGLFWGNVVGLKDPEVVNAPTQPTSDSPIPEVVVLVGHVGPVETLAFTADQKNIITGGSDRQIILWNAFTGEQVRRFRGSRSNIASISVSKNDKNFVSCSAVDRRVLLWDVNSESIFEEYPSTRFEASTVAVSADALNVGVGLMDGQITFFRKSDAGSTPKEETFKGHLLAVNRIRFSPDEQFFLTCGNDRAVTVWETKTFRKKTSFRFHKGAVLCADFSPDGRWVVSAGTDKTAILWSIDDGEVKHRFSGHVGDISEVAFSADGTQIMTASKDRTVVLWDAKTGEKSAVCEKRNSPIVSAAWNQLNGSVALGCMNGTVEILAPSAFVSEKSGVPEPGDALIASGRSDRSTLDPVARKRKALMELPRGQLMYRFGNTSNYSDTGDVSPNGLNFASVNSERGEGTLWDATNGKVTRILRTPQVLSAIRFHTKDSNFLVTGSKNGEIQYWNLSADKTTGEFPGHNSPIQTLVVSAEGTRFLTGAGDGTVILWDLLAKKQLQSFEASTKGILSLAMSKDGKHFAVGSGENTVGLWTLVSEETWTFTEQKLVGHESGDVSVAFSPDGTRLFSAAADGRAILWDVASGQMRREFKAHTDAILSVAISPNGQYLLTGGKSEEFSLLWNVDADEPIMIFPFQGGPVTNLMFHPKHLSVITLGGRTPLYWNITDLRGK